MAVPVAGAPSRVTVIPTCDFILLDNSRTSGRGRDCYYEMDCFCTRVGIIVKWVEYRDQLYGHFGWNSTKLFGTSNGRGVSERERIGFVGGFSMVVCMGPKFVLLN